MEDTSTKDHFTSGGSDSDISLPPSSAVPSEPSSAVPSELGSAVVSESELPSEVASEPDLLPQPEIKRFKMQTGIQDFFRILSEDEARIMQTKRKRADSGEEVDPVELSKKRQERKLIHKRERNLISQQRR